MQYNSLYAGVVADTADPKRLGRVKARLGMLGDAFTTHWLLPMSPGAGPNCGIFCVPPVGAGVVVLFDEGDLEAGWSLGGYWAEPAKRSEVPQVFQRIPPTNQGMRSPKGHTLQLDDLPVSAGIRLTSANKLSLQLDDMRKQVTVSTPNKQTVRLDDATGEIQIRTSKGACVQLHADGSVQLKTAQGAQLTLSAQGDVQARATSGAQLTLGKQIQLQEPSGQTVTLQQGKVQIQSTTAVELKAPSVTLSAGKLTLGTAAKLHPALAETIAQVFNTHTHGTSMGPSTPPVVPMLANAIGSKTVTVGG
ncbi:MAG: phage baseplate assembly protein V [Myxococcota bacterium]